MNKACLLFVAAAGLVSGVALTSCSPKMTPAHTAAAPKETDFVPFTKSLKQRMEHDHVDIKKVQFYIDQNLVLSRTLGSETGTVSGGRLEFNNNQSVNEVTIPAYTPGVCERVVGDSLFISFDAPGNTLVFSALFANQFFSLSSPSWYSGMANVTYDNQPYLVRCEGCGSAANARLVVRKTEQIINANKPANVNKTVIGRTVK